MSMKTNYLTRGGICTAITIILIYLSIIMPTGKLFFLGAASCLIPLLMLITDLKTSIIVYAASSILSILLFNFRGNVILYILLFGSYGIIKNFIEKAKKLPIEIILKLIYFNIILAIVAVIGRLFGITIVKSNFPIAAIIIISEIVFLIYDYVLSLFISFIIKHYIKKFNKIGKYS